MHFFNLGRGEYTQYPTTTDFAVEFSTFGETLGISTSGVQTLSLVLELTFKTRLALSSERSTGLCLLSAEFKKIYYHAWLRKSNF